MNEQLPRPRRQPTQAAEGLPRWRWTLAEFDRFIELGILTEDDRVELIGGELVPMAAKGVGHEDVRGELHDWFVARLPGDLRLREELGWRPNSDTYCEPDLLIFPRTWKPFSTVPATEVDLLVEVADTTLKFDTATKAPLYASLGVREYWVINAVNLETRIHRKPSARGCHYRRTFAKDALLTPTLAPALAVRLHDLDTELA